MVITIFLIKDKEKMFQFLEETFLLANLGMNIALEIAFLILSNVKINFGNQNLS